MEPLSKIISLIKKTGDKAIILDKYGEPSYVVMTVADYERLVLGKSEIYGLTEDELLAKINRDIEIWKDSLKDDRLPIEQHDFSKDLGQNSDWEPDFPFDSDHEPAELDDFSPILANLTDDDDDRYYFETVE